ncbi:MAG: undecaprenyldiphospho-muramoylpentapeptide beta-N-acetylglucosaminyltransferase [Candidatus Omnitrophota bacterium]|jgi:UDP-N-acetylglucosamine--N-acetylmuramyl-(pentapeptide) pyrophosphoryl-undecaprenol N-acetylglucosamine transferase
MKILIAAGGTGGHILPALALAGEIKTRNVGEVLFVISSKKQDAELVSSKGIDYLILPIAPLQSKNIFSILNFLTRLFAGTIGSFSALLKFRPDAVVGFGGYVSGPIVLAAGLLGIKTMIHEQNVVPGKANRILARFVGTIAISFPDAKKYFKGFESKVILSGNPLREGLKRDDRERTGNFFSVLVIGGSQGAHKLNTMVPEALGLMPEGARGALNVIHIAGKNEKEEVEKSYAKLGIKNRVFSFTEHMARLYNECDFVISRAGAMTVSELLELAIPAILVPYPYAAAHQRMNAEVLEKTGSAIVLEEKYLTRDTLKDVVSRLMDRNILKEMSARAKSVDKPDARKILIKELCR